MHFKVKAGDRCNSHHFNEGKYSITIQWKHSTEGQHSFHAGKYLTGNFLQTLLRFNNRFLQLILDRCTSRLTVLQLELRDLYLSIRQFYITHGYFSALKALLLLLDRDVRRAVCDN